MAKLQFLGGVGEIGGNRILVQEGGSNIFLDFGKSYTKESQYFDFPLLQPRHPKHLLGLGILPNLKGLYKDQEEAHDIAGIILSHPHGDHWDYMRFVKDDIPIYCSELTKRVILAREMSAQGLAIEYRVANLTQKGGRKTLKTFKSFSPGGERNAGGFPIRGFEVDHSIPGCYGLVLETKAGNIAYTGDLRIAGPRQQVTENFIMKAREADPKVLIVEGTNIGTAQISSEDEVEEKVSTIVGSTKQLVIASFAGGDAQRITTFLKVAKKHGRKLALSMKQAFLLQELKAEHTFSGPSLEDSSLLIFQKEKKTERQFEFEVRTKYEDKTVDSIALNQMQSEVILAAGLLDFNELIEVDPNPGSVFILSQSEPFNEEMELDFEKLRNWLARYGLPLYEAHASGHAKPHELKSLVATIHAKKTYLVHTDYPELYQRYLADLAAQIEVPQIGVEYEI